MLQHEQITYNMLCWIALITLGQIHLYVHRLDNQQLDVTSQQKQINKYQLEGFLLSFTMLYMPPVYRA